MIKYYFSNLWCYKSPKIWFSVSSEKNFSKWMWKQPSSVELCTFISQHGEAHTQLQEPEEKHMFDSRGTKWQTKRVWKENRSLLRILNPAHPSTVAERQQEHRQTLVKIWTHKYRFSCLMKPQNNLVPVTRKQSGEWRGGQTRICSTVSNGKKKNKERLVVWLSLNLNINNETVLWRDTGRISAVVEWAEGFRLSTVLFLRVCSLIFTGGEIDEKTDTSNRRA